MLGLNQRYTSWVLLVLGFRSREASAFVVGKYGLLLLFLHSVLRYDLLGVLQGEEVVGNGDLVLMRRGLLGICDRICAQALTVFGEFLDGFEGLFWCWPF